MGNNHVKAWATVVLGFGYFVVIVSVIGLIKLLWDRKGEELPNWNPELMALSGFLSGSLLILVGSYVLWKVELTERNSHSSP